MLRVIYQTNRKITGKLLFYLSYKIHFADDSVEFMTKLAMLLKINVSNVISMRKIFLKEISI